MEDFQLFSNICNEVNRLYNFIIANTPDRYPLYVPNITIIHNFNFTQYPNIDQYFQGSSADPQDELFLNELNVFFNSFENEVFIIVCDSTRNFIDYHGSNYIIVETNENLVGGIVLSLYYYYYIILNFQRESILRNVSLLSEVIRGNYSGFFNDILHNKHFSYLTSHLTYNEVEELYHVLSRENINNAYLTPVGRQGNPRFALQNFQ